MDTIARRLACAKSKLVHFFTAWIISFVGDSRIEPTRPFVQPPATEHIQQEGEASRQSYPARAIMSDPASRAVFFISSLSSMRRNGGFVRGFASLAFSPRYFPRVLAATMVVSGVSGYVAMESYQAYQRRAFDVGSAPAERCVNLSILTLRGVHFSSFRGSPLVLPIPLSLRISLTLSLPSNPKNLRGRKRPTSGHGTATGGGQIGDNTKRAAPERGGGGRPTGSAP